MLYLINYKNNPEGIEIYFDDEGVDELIDYLSSLKSEKDHMHLIAGNELTEESQIEIKNKNAVVVKHVRLQYEK